MNLQRTDWYVSHFKYVMLSLYVSISLSMRTSIEQSNLRCVGFEDNFLCNLSKSLQYAGALTISSKINGTSFSNHFIGIKERLWKGSLPINVIITWENHQGRCKDHVCTKIGWNRIISMMKIWIGDDLQCVICKDLECHIMPHMRFTSRKKDSRYSYLVSIDLCVMVGIRIICELCDGNFSHKISTNKALVFQRLLVENIFLSCHFCLFVFFSGTWWWESCTMGCTAHKLVSDEARRLVILRKSLLLDVFSLFGIEEFTLALDAFDTAIRKQHEQHQGLYKIIN